MAVSPALASLTVADVMSRNPVTVALEDRLSHAADVMEQHHVQHLPVTRNGELVAILSERNLRDAVPSVLTLSDPAARRRALAATRVEKIASKDLVVVSPTTSLRTAIKMMRARRLGSLPVVEHGRLVGIVTAGDLIGLLDRVLRDAEDAATGPRPS